VPPGTLRYWSWLFAAPEAREPLLGTYALLAEWRALTDPSIEAAVAHIKLDWWRHEIRRVATGTPTHPITRYLAGLPGVRIAELARLEEAVDAAAAQAAGVPLERGSDLESHAGALYATPLVVAARATTSAADPRGMVACTTALAAADYLARTTADYRRDARAGRVPFPVEELLAAGIDNDDLTAAAPSDRLQIYLEELRGKAANYYSASIQALAPAARPALRHLSVLAALGARHLNSRRSPSSADFRLGDLYNAWNAARRAAASR
jgi:15-cis-phytoene synthase